MLCAGLSIGLGPACGFRVPLFPRYRAAYFLEEIFDASLALEFMGFTSPELQEGLSSYKEKREPNFNRHSEI